MSQTPPRKPRKNVANRAEKQTLDWELVGGSEHIVKLREKIIDVAKRIQEKEFGVLIEGPTGTGKELIAKEIGWKSGRIIKIPVGEGKTEKEKGFVPINCAGFAAGFFEDGLFGHMRGAFTGAIQGKSGLIEEAGGGILFLDEIGDLSPENQGKILRFLEEKTYIPVGGKEKQIDDIRIIAATNKDLWKEINAGKFREDLYHRLSQYIIPTIPLKDRRVDIIFLLNHLINKIKLKIDPQAKALLYSYDFPGNVRELKNLLVHAGDYQYIRHTLAREVASLIEKDAKVLLRDMERTKIWIEKRSNYQTISDRDERSRKMEIANEAIHFFDAIAKVDLNDRDWEKETQRYEILTLWGKTEFSKEDIRRILGIRTNLLTPKIFKKKFGLDLPSRTQLRADIEALGFKLYPDYIMKFPWSP
jgi:transcriptional regulator with PAS, ATPase and Fis domain